MEQEPNNNDRNEAREKLRHELESALDLLQKLSLRIRNNPDPRGQVELEHYLELIEAGVRNAKDALDHLE